MGPVNGQSQRGPPGPAPAVQLPARFRDAGRRVGRGHGERDGTQIPAVLPQVARHGDCRARRNAIVPQSFGERNGGRVVAVARAVAQPHIDRVFAFTGHLQPLQHLVGRVEQAVGGARRGGAEAHVRASDPRLVQRFLPEQAEAVVVLPTGRLGAQIDWRGRRVRVDTQCDLMGGLHIAGRVFAGEFQHVFARFVHAERRAGNPIAFVDPVARGHHAGVGIQRIQGQGDRGAVPARGPGQALGAEGGCRRGGVVAQQRRERAIALVGVAGGVAQPQV